MSEHLWHVGSEISIFLITGLLGFFVTWLIKVYRMMNRVDVALTDIENQKKKLESIELRTLVQDRIWSHVLKQEVDSGLIAEGKQSYPKINPEFFCPKHCNDG